MEVEIYPWRPLTVVAEIDEKILTVKFKKSDSKKKGSHYLILRVVRT